MYFHKIRQRLIVSFFKRAREIILFTNITTAQFRFSSHKMSVTAYPLTCLKIFCMGSLSFQNDEIGLQSYRLDLFSEKYEMISRTLKTFETKEPRNQETTKEVFNYATREGICKFWLGT